MAVYNVSALNGTNVLSTITSLESAAGYSFLIGNLLLLSFFLIFLVLAFRNEFKQTLVVGSFLTTLLAVFLAGAGMIAITTIAYPAVLFFIALVFFLLS